MGWRAILSDSVVSNYVIFGLGLLVGLAVHVWRVVFKRASIIEVVKQREIDLITMSDEAREKLKIKYEDKTVESFYLTSFEVRNRSGHTIENIYIKILFEPPNVSPEIYEVGIEDPIGDARNPAADVKVEGLFGLGNFQFSLKIPFLNDRRVEKDLVVMNVYSPKPLVVEKVEGGGRGWMSRYKDNVAYNERLDRFVKDAKGPFDLAVNLTLAGILRRWRR